MKEVTAARYSKSVREGCIICKEDQTSGLASNASPISGAFPITTFTTPFVIR